MARKPKPSAVNAKMYRHFAAATIAVTGCVALFANGETAQYEEEQAAIELAQVDALAADANKLKNKAAGYGARRIKGVNQQLIDNRDGGGMASAPVTYGALEDDPGTSYAYGPGPNGLGPNGLPTPKPTGAVPRKPTEEDILKLMEASRIRSGAPSIG